MTSPASTARANAKPTLDALTGLRFIAAFGVVLYHFVRFEGPAAAVNELLHNGHIAVEFFFVLSGFILAYNYLSPTRTLDRGRFWAARFARIYAVYITAMLAYLPFYWWKLRVAHEYDVSRSLQQIALVTPLVTTMTQSFYPIVEIVAEWNTPAWSLSCEAFFYAAFPFAAIYFGRLGVRGAIWAAVATWAAALALSFWVIPNLPQEGSFAFVRGEIFWGSHPIPNLALFLNGIAWGRLFLLTRESAVLQRLAGPFSTALLLAILIFLSLHRGTGSGDLVLLFIFPVFGVLIYALAWQRGPAARLLSLPGVVLLGEASYALYMWQAPIWAYHQQFWYKVLHRGTGFGFSATYVVLALLGSIAVHYVIERPARRWVAQRLT